jgi:hypothetical protein
MTRDEALKIMSRIWGGNPQHALAKSYVDAFVALGILKLDEPRSFQKKLEDFVSDSRLVQGGMQDRFGSLFKVLDSCGLKIVEK